MDTEKFHEVRLKMLMHDMHCPNPNDMYYIELAKQVQFKKKQLEELCVKLNDAGDLDSFEKALDDASLMKELLEKYGMSNKRPELTVDERERMQVNCLKNVMNDLSVTVEHAIELLTIEENEREKYINLLK